MRETISKVPGSLGRRAISGMIAIRTAPVVRPRRPLPTSSHSHTSTQQSGSSTARPTRPQTQPGRVASAARAASASAWKASGSVTPGTRATSNTRTPWQDGRMAAKSRSRNQRPGAPRGGRPTPRTPHPRVRQNVPVEAVANKVAVRTAPGLAWMGRLPKIVLPAFVAIGVVGGLIAGGILGLVLLVLVVGLLGWLLAAFWPMLPTAGRVLRVAALLAVVVVAVLECVTV